MSDGAFTLRLASPASSTWENWKDDSFVHSHSRKRLFVLQTPIGASFVFLSVLCWAESVGRIAFYRSCSSLSELRCKLAPWGGFSRSTDVPDYGLRAYFQRLRRKSQIYKGETKDGNICRNTFCSSISQKYSWMIGRHAAAYWSREEKVRHRTVWYSIALHRKVY